LPNWIEKLLVFELAGLFELLIVLRLNPHVYVLGSEIIDVLFGTEVLVSELLTMVKERATFKLNIVFPHVILPVLVFAEAQLN